MEYHYREIRENTSFIYKVITSGFVLTILFFLVNASLQQLQMSIFSGNIPIQPIVLKVLLLLLALAGALFNIRKKIDFRISLVVSWCLFVSLVVYEISLIAETKFQSLPSLLFGLNVYYFFMITAPLILYMQKSVSEKVLIRILLILFLPLSALGISQFFLLDPLIPTFSVDETFKVYSWDYYDLVRGFSLFDSGYSFGHYISLVAAVTIASKMDWRIKVLIMALVAVAGYSTLTRNAYMEIVAVSFSALVIRYFISNKKAPYLLCIFNAILGFVVIYLVPLITQKFSSSDSELLANESFLQRQEQWKVVFDMWLNGNTFTRLFGTGLVQNDKLDTISFGALDNMFLAVGLQIGIIGLVVWGLLLLSISYHIFIEAHRNRAPLSVGIAAFWTSFPLVSLFNISITTYMIVFFLFVIARPSNPVVTNETTTPMIERISGKRYSKAKASRMYYF